jgi:hypothetical protein
LFCAPPVPRVLEYRAGTSGHDSANREAVKRCRPDEVNLVGLALRDERKLVDRITKGALMHP